MSRWRWGIDFGQRDVADQRRRGIKNRGSGRYLGGSHSSGRVVLGAQVAHGRDQNRGDAKRVEENLLRLSLIKRLRKHDRARRTDQKSGHGDRLIIRFGERLAGIQERRQHAEKDEG